mgnify:FL=1
MRSIDGDETAMVSGGNSLLWSALKFVYKEREQIGEFFEGFFEGYGDNQEAHR